MRKILSTIISLSLINGIFVQPVRADNAAEIYVSAAGSSDASGTFDEPVNNIEAAMELAKQYSDRNVDVLLMGGRYELKNTISFSSANSGGDGCNITYRPYNDEDVVFTGAKQLSASDFGHITDAEVLKDIPQEARGSVLMLDLDRYGLSYGDSVRPYLYVDNALQTTARYPNGGLLKATNANDSSTFAFNSYDVSKWSGADDAVLCGSTLSTYFWRNLDMSTSGNLITVSGTVRKDAEFYVENLIEELDIPGEYFVDRTDNILYYYPTNEFNENSVVEVTAFFDHAVRMNSCRNITFDGITFEKMGGDAFYITGADNIVIKNCTIDFVQGEDAIYLKGSNSEISDNSFYGCANNVIEIHGGSVATLTEGNVSVKNNRISFCGYTGRHSVIYSGTDSTSSPSDYGNLISNNLIQDCMTFMGIVCNANETKILYNEIVNPGYLIGDGGAIYMGKSNVKYGMEVAYNYIHDGHKGNSAYAYCGLYSDDGYSGNNYHHNVVKDMYQGMIVGVGMNSRFNNNLFINNSIAPYVQSRMTDYTSSKGAYESGYESMMYNEAYNIKERTVYGSTFMNKYTLIDEALSRTPYFAPWNTEVTGNILIGENGTISRPWHPYYKKSSTAPVIEGEADVVAKNSYKLKYGKKYIGSNTVTGYYVDELELYGAKITDGGGNDLNATTLGNPSYEYDDAHFKDASNQDYTLSRALSSDVSSAYEIDMSYTGVISTSNSDMYKTADKPVLVYPKNNSACESDTVLMWERVRNASKYIITISENSNLENPVLELTVQDSSLDLVKSISLDTGKTYYWNVKACGLAKSDSFETVSDTYSFTTSMSANTDRLSYALSILDSQLEKYESGMIDYTDTDIYEKLKLLSETAHSVLSSSGKQTEIDECENAILDALALYSDSVIYFLAEITECAVDQDTDNVYVSAQGFEPDSLVSIMVTNPLYSLDSAVDSFNLDSVQYSDTVNADSDGNVRFTFNTRVKNEDRSGVYTVYMSGKYGRIISKSYEYGTIRAGEVTFMNDNNIIMDLSSYMGQNITMLCTVSNSTHKSFYPAIVNAFYAADGTLCDVQLADSVEIKPQESRELRWTVKLTEADTAKILFFDSLAALRPFEKCRVIYEAASQSDI